MANITTLVTITDSGKAGSTTGATATDVALDLVKVGSPVQATNNLQQYIQKILSRSRTGNIAVQVQNGNAVAASATVTLASALAADTVTICGVTLTATAGSTTGTAFKVGVTNTADAAALAACIALNPTLSTFLTATSALAVTTIKASTAGVGGNGYTIASSNGGRLAVSGATFTGGVADTGATNTYSFT